MVLEGKVKEFMHYLEHDAITQQGKQGYGLGSRRIAYSSIMSFFDHNQYPLRMKSGDRPSGEGLGSRIPEKAEVLKLVNTAKSRRHRSVILFLKDSGLRLSDVVKLKWKDIRDYGEGFWGFKLITRKRGVKALAFIGYETTESLKQLKRKSERIFPMTAKTLSNAISVLIEEAALEPGLSAHGLRKFFNAELQSARVPKEWRYIMMGKKFGVYDENRITKLLQAYKENYQTLTIFGVGEKRVRDLEKEVADLRAELDQRTKIYVEKLREYGEIVETFKETYPQQIERYTKAIDKAGQRADELADQLYEKIMKKMEERKTKQRT